MAQWEVGYSSEREISVADFRRFSDGISYQRWFFGKSIG
jgi:hypothetical protein